MRRRPVALRASRNMAHGGAARRPFAGPFFGGFDRSSGPDGGPDGDQGGRGAAGAQMGCGARAVARSVASVAFSPVLALAVALLCAVLSPGVAVARPGAADPSAGSVADAGAPLVVSESVEARSVTVYRAPGRPGGQLNLHWLDGYALISEKRRVHLPAGAATVRFEGVADGMIAVSAVVSGLPGGVEEKNRDARLLSPASLLDGSFGNRVHIRRTDRATGRVSETEAIIRSGADGAVVLETREGMEALRCSGLPETLVYDHVPDGLSARPSFSVRTDSPRATDAEVTLTYLATGFDWNAHYVATLAKNGKTLDLFAWLTVANGNGADFPGAHLLAVAGEPHRDSDFRTLSARYGWQSLDLACWPATGSTTLLPPPPPPALPPVLAAPPMEIIVTAARSKVADGAMAQQEDLGDLKLYRVPMPVDVLPNAQKQVALLERTRVPVRLIYTASPILFDRTPFDTQAESRPLDIVLRTTNRAKDGLGLPLPAGGVDLMQAAGETELLVARSDLSDRAVDERVEIAAGRSDQVRLESRQVANGKTQRTVRLSLSNALDRAAAVEIRLPRQGGWSPVAGGPLREKDGALVWAVSLPAHGRAELDVVYRQR